MPPGPRALLEGKRLMEEGKPDRAVQALLSATGVMPSNPDAWNYLGVAYHRAGLHADAHGAYHRAIQLKPSFAEARYNLGCLQLDLMQWNNAADTLTGFTILDPDSLSGWLRLGFAQLRARQFAAAERTYQQALLLSPKNPEALNNLGVLALLRQHYADAANYFAASADSDPNYPQAPLNLAIVSQQYLHQKQAAVRGYRQFLACAPDAPQASAVRTLLLALEEEMGRSTAATNISIAVHMPRPATNQNSRTAQPATTATNPPARIAVPSETPGNVASTPSVPEQPIAQPVQPPESRAPTNTVAVAPLPQPVVVRAQPGPAVASNAVPPVAVSRQTNLVNAATNTAPPVAAGAPGNPPALDEPVDNKQPDRPTGLAFLNPRNWFGPRRDRAAASQDAGSPGFDPGGATPLDSAAQPFVPRPQTADAPVTPANPPLNPPPAPPPPPRYAYRHPVAGPRGDSAKAVEEIRQGLQAHRAKQWPAALASYQRATQADPSLFEGWYNLGLAAQEAANLPLALGSYEQALAIDPSAVDARYNFALALQQTGHHLDAANELDGVLSRDPSAVRAHLALANIYANSLRDFPRARHHYLKVLSLSPQHPQAAAIRYWLASNR